MANSTTRSSDYYLRRARASIRRGEHRQALRALDAALAISPQDDRLLKVQAEFRKRTVREELRKAAASGEWDFAIKQLERFSRLTPGDADYAALRARIWPRYVAALRNRIAELESGAKVAGSGGSSSEATLPRPRRGRKDG